MSDNFDFKIDTTNRTNKPTDSQISQAARQIDKEADGAGDRQTDGFG